jgi:hypothetical protein
MKRSALSLIGIGLTALALAGCEDASKDSLTNGGGGSVNDPNATAGGADNTFNHNNDPGAADPAANAQPPEPAQVRYVGSPEVTSRLHACGKMTVTSFGNLLASRGLTGGGTRPANAPSGIALFGNYNAQTQMATASAPTAAALGAANYNGRVPEAPFASTSAMAKMFDIFTMASYDAIAANWTSAACPGVKVVGTDGKLTKDGISCLIGRPASDEHLAIANDAIAKNPTDGAKIAIAALLSAAHTCQ